MQGSKAKLDLKKIIHRIKVFHLLTKHFEINVGGIL